MTIPTTPVPTGPDRASVYLLARKDRRRFKLGWARSPIVRARKLPEFDRGELDLDASRVIWLPTRPRAEQVERSMHKTLAPHKVEIELRRNQPHDGHQEWFAGHVQDAALHMLSQMPLQPQSSVTARVLPLTMPEPPVGAVSIETGPQDTWWRIEDILARLAMHCAITVDAPDRRGGQLTVTVHQLKRMTQPQHIELRRAVLDADNYQCWRDGRPLAFVQTLGWQGEDLVLSFMPLTVLERWEEGPELVWQVRSFLARLARQSRVPRSA